MSRRSVGRSAYRAAQLEAQHDNAPRERGALPPDRPRTVITQAMIDEWLQNDEELRTWRDQEARPRLW